MDSPVLHDTYHALFLYLMNSDLHLKNLSSNIQVSACFILTWMKQMLSFWKLRTINEWEQWRSFVKKSFPWLWTSPLQTRGLRLRLYYHGICNRCIDQTESTPVTCNIIYHQNGSHRVIAILVKLKRHSPFMFHVCTFNPTYILHIRKVRM